MHPNTPMKPTLPWRVFGIGFWLAAVIAGYWITTRTYDLIVPLFR